MSDLATWQEGLCCHHSWEKEIPSSPPCSPRPRLFSGHKCGDYSNGHNRTKYSPPSILLIFPLLLPCNPFLISINYLTRWRRPNSHMSKRVVKRHVLQPFFGIGSQTWLIVKFTYFCCCFVFWCLNLNHQSRWMQWSWQKYNRNCSQPQAALHSVGWFFWQILICGKGLSHHVLQPFFRHWQPDLGRSPITFFRALAEGFALSTSYSSFHELSIGIWVGGSRTDASPSKSRLIVIIEVKNDDHHIMLSCYTGNNSSTNKNNRDNIVSPHSRHKWEWGGAWTGPPRPKPKFNIPLSCGVCHNRYQQLPYTDDHINSTLTIENVF